MKLLLTGRKLQSLSSFIVDGANCFDSEETSLTDYLILVNGEDCRLDYTKRIMMINGPNEESGVLKAWSRMEKKLLSEGEEKD